MDRLSKRKFVIVCHEKVVRIPLEGDEILRVHGARTQGVMKTLMNTKCRLLRGGAWSSFEVSVGITEEGEVKRRVKLRRVREMPMTIQSGVKDKILATTSETSKVENAPAEMLRDLDQQMEKRADDGCTLWIKLYSKYEYEIRYHPSRANVVIDALRRKERVKPRRVRAGMMRTVVMDEAHASRFRWMIYLVVLADAAESVSDAIRFEYCLASSSGWTKSPVIWAEIGGSSLIGPELVQEIDTTDNEFPEELSSVHGTFHVSNLKKCLADANLHVPLNEIKIDKTLHFVEELVEIMDREIRNLKLSKIPLMKVH
ncbi:hypothetical protein Tco_0788129 [Tanacetum coccineum]